MPIPTNLRDPRRRFGTRARSALHCVAGGRCERCGTDLFWGWHADHVSPHAEGGATALTNGAALCPTCNRLKGGSIMTRKFEPREWQEEFRGKYEAHEMVDFVADVVPGGGKSSAVLDAVARAIRGKRKDRAIFVVPTRNIGEAFIREARELFGLGIDWWVNGKGVRNGRINTDGFVTTYQRVASSPEVYALEVAKGRTVVVFDEFHHMGDEADWGRKAKIAFGGAESRIFMTGTAFRCDKSRIPFVRHDADGFIIPDYTYGWTEGWEDKIIRPMTFHQFGADAPIGEELIPMSEVSEEDSGAALRSAYMTGSDWLYEVVEAAVEDLAQRRKTRPTAGGLVICASIAMADEVAKLMTSGFGISPVVIHGDAEGDQSAAIDAFRGSAEPWLVTVKMVSEGVNLPRLEVEIYASSAKTPLAWQQAVARVGRVVEGEGNVTAAIYFAGIPELLANASDLTRKQAAAEALDDDREPREGTGEPSERVGRVIGPAVNAKYVALIKDGEAIPADVVERLLVAWEAKGFPRDLVAAFNAYNLDILTDADLDAVVPTPPLPPLDIAAANREFEALRAEFNKRQRKIGQHLTNTGDTPPEGFSNWFSYVGTTLKGDRKFDDLILEELREIVMRARGWESRL